MMRKLLHLLALLVVLSFSMNAGAMGEAPEQPVEQTAAAEINFTGIWEGPCLLSTVVAHVHHEGNRLHGVAFVHAPDGEINPYHFEGELRDGVITASHFRGHTFTSSMLSADAVKGTIKTAKKGYVIPLRAKRTSDTPTEE
jgi:hypothetical protein